jgi:signal transduction histidine kinase
MTPSCPDTAFLPAARTDEQTRRDEQHILQTYPVVATLCDAMPMPVAILDACREIVLCNQPLLDAVGAVSLEDLDHARPGEALGCRVAACAPGGCGTAQECRSCGAALAIVAAGRGRGAERVSCVIDRDDTMVPLELEASARAFSLDGHDFTMVTLIDVQRQHRDRMLERMFFHDVLNTVGGVVGLSELVASGETTDLPDLGSVLAAQGRRLYEQILSHRDLIAAENGDLPVNRQPVHVHDIMQETRDGLVHHACAAGRRVILQTGPDAMLRTDPVLFGRVLGNILKNALEACPTGQAVSFSHGREAGQSVIRIWNPMAVPAEVQPHLFRHPYSTRGPGRGMGAYGARLLLERYLGGTLTFATSEQDGTTVTVEIPSEAIPREAD